MTTFPPQTATFGVQDHQLSHNVHGLNISAEEIREKQEGVCWTCNQNSQSAISCIKESSMDDLRTAAEGKAFPKTVVGENKKLSLRTQGSGEVKLL